MNYQPLKRNLFLIAIATAGTSQVQAEANNQITLDNITVVGEKTERTLKDTTSSVSVIGEEELSSMEHISVSSAIAEVPNVVVLSGSKPNIRGVSGNGSATGFNSFTGGAKARVSRLVDGVAEPFVADLTGDTGLWDVEQIEVFRGPQSTNNGRSSIGGSVYIKTNDPTFDWEGKARLGVRNQDQLIDTSVVASGPIIADQLAFRLAAQRLDGDTYNDGAEFDTHTSRFDLNELKNQTLRGKLLLQPDAISGFSALLSHTSTEEEGDAGREYFIEDDLWNKYVPLTQRYMDTESDTTSLKLDYSINDHTSIDLLVAKTDFSWGFKEYNASQASQSDVIMEQDNTSIDSKIRYYNPESMVNGFIGLAYSKQEQEFSSAGAFNYNGDDESSSAALYSEVSLAATDKIEITVGARREQDKQERVFSMNGQTAKLDRDKSIILPKLVLQYDVSTDTVIALSSRKGYNQGGGALDYRAGEYYYFDEESVIAHEISSRSSLLEGNLNVRANLFYNKYDGYQATNSLRRIANVNEAKTYGLELEANYLVNANLELRSGVGLLETKIEDAGDEYPEVDGNRLDSAPGFSANIGAQYWLTHDLDIDLSARYVGEYFGDISNSKERTAGDFVIAGLKLNYDINNWLISAFVSNLANKEARTSRQPANPARNDPAYASVIDPRTVGASVTYSF